MAPTDTSEEDSMVEAEEETIEEHEEIPQEEHGNEEDHIEEHEEIPQEEHQNEEEFIEFPSLKEPQVEVSKKEEPTTKFVAYRHPHHLEKQQPSSKGWEHQRAYYGSRWNHKGKQYGSTWRNTRNTWRYQSSTAGTWKQKNQNRNQDDREAVRPHIHISLGWMDDRAWYQLTTILKRS